MNRLKLKTDTRSLIMQGLIAAVVLVMGGLIDANIYGLNLRWIIPLAGFGALYGLADLLLVVRARRLRAREGSGGGPTVQRSV
jgi:hypothetical protein